MKENCVFTPSNLCYAKNIITFYVFALVNYIYMLWAADNLQSAALASEVKSWSKANFELTKQGSCTKRMGCLEIEYKSQAVRPLHTVVWTPYIT